MKFNKLVIPGLLAGVLLIGGAGAASAFGGGTFNLDAFKNFSTEQQTAIQKAFEIRKTADEEAKTVLDDAGVDMSAMHDAMETERKAGREKLDAALESKDYAAFVELTKDSPMKGDISEDTFNKMAEAHALMKSGDTEGARTIMESLGLKGPGGMGMGHGGRGMHDDRNDADADDN